MMTRGKKYCSPLPKAAVDGCWMVHMPGAMQHAKLGSTEAAKKPTEAGIWRVFGDARQRSSMEDAAGRGFTSSARGFLATNRHDPASVDSSTQTRSLISFDGHDTRARQAGHRRWSVPGVPQTTVMGPVKTIRLPYRQVKTASAILALKYQRMIAPVRKKNRRRVGGCQVLRKIR